jgi:hypothetical protein
MIVHESQKNIDQQPQITPRLKVSQWAETAALVTACAFFVLSILALCQAGAFAHFSQATSFGYGCLASSLAIFLGELIYKVIQSCQIDPKTHFQTKRSTAANDLEKEQTEISSTFPDNIKSNSASSDVSPQVTMQAQQQSISRKNEPTATKKQSEIEAKIPPADASQIDPQDSHKCEIQVAKSEDFVKDLSRHQIMLNFGFTTNISSKMDDMCSVSSLRIWDETHYLVEVRERKYHQNSYPLGREHLLSSISLAWNNKDLNVDVLADVLKNCEEQLKSHSNFKEESICCMLISDEKIQTAKIGNFRAILYPTHNLSTALGTDKPWIENPKSFKRDWSRGSYMVIASEGFWQKTSETDVLIALTKSDKEGTSPYEIAHKMIEAAQEPGSVENITVFVAKL